MKTNLHFKIELFVYTMPASRLFLYGINHLFYLFIYRKLYQNKNKLLETKTQVSKIASSWKDKLILDWFLEQLNWIGNFIGKIQYYWNIFGIWSLVKLNYFIRTIHMQLETNYSLAIGNKLFTHSLLYCHLHLFFSTFARFAKLMLIKFKFHI